MTLSTASAAALVRPAVPTPEALVAAQADPPVEIAVSREERLLRRM